MACKKGDRNEREREHCRECQLRTRQKRHWEDSDVETRRESLEKEQEVSWSSLVSIFVLYIAFGGLMGTAAAAVMELASNNRSPAHSAVAGTRTCPHSQQMQH